MCGISVICSASRSARVSQLLRSMHAPIAHRGPDGEGGLLFDGQEARRFETVDAMPALEASAGFAFRRLKIVDLSARAAQPMQSLGSGNWIVFNGEIYNYRKLREQLEAAGHRFASESDTEVILAAYDEWGTDCFQRLEGMWAIVILDVARRMLIASRDRLGIKPLYWSISDGMLLLASEIRQILAVTQRSEANVPLVMRYLRGNRLPCYDETFFAGIRSVPAGSWFQVPVGMPIATPEFHSFWSLRRIVAPQVNGDASARYTLARTEFATLLQNTIESHRHADVRVGSLLSGGLDSGVIASILSQTAGEEVPTFSFGFRDRAPGWCELPFVDAIVQANRRLLPHETSFDADWLAANAARVIRALEEPPLALPALAQFRTFELCRAYDTTVVLDGEGSDEILAGYVPYQRALLVDFAMRRRPLQFAAELRAIARRQDRTAPGILYDFFVAPSLRRLRAKSPAWLAAPPAATREAVDKSDDSSLVNRMLYDATRWGNVKIVLSYTDKNAMAHSVEARVPFMDHRVVEYAFSLPAEFKAGHGDRKRVLRDLGRSLLPPAVTERKDRMGFATPDHLLMSGRFDDVVRATISDDSFLSLPLFDRGEIRRFVSSPDADPRTRWRLYALATWRKEFNVSI